MYRASLVAQMVKHLPAMRETWVQCLGLEDHLEKEMATYSSILAWETPWTEEPGGLRSSPVGLTQSPRYVLFAVTHKSLRSLLNSIRPL